MRLLITVENHLFRGADGCIYGHGPASYGVWTRYAEFFEEVVLLARVRNSTAPDSSSQRVDGPAVSVHGLPEYAGPWRYAWNLPALKARVRQVVSSCDAYLLRIPGLIGRLAWREIHKLERPFAAELLGDPWDSLGPGSVKAFLRPLYRHLLTRDTKSICAQADVVLYVSQEALQRRYPVGRDAYSFNSSDVILPCGFAESNQMAARFQRIEKLQQFDNQQGQPMRLGFIGSLEQMYKGPDIFLRALSLCLQSGLKFNAFLVGEGRYRQAMESLALELSLRNHVTFLGQLGFGKPIADFLDFIDLFVMPSRQEGLPRTLVEAMARGCPCIASRVGGIPELLDGDDIFSPGNTRTLTDKVLEVTQNPRRLTNMSRRNLERSRHFHPDILRRARRRFLQQVCLCSGAASGSSTKVATPYGR